MAVPNDPHRTRAEAKIAELEAALADEAGAGPAVRLVIDAAAGEPPLRDEAVPLATASARIVAEVANVDRHRAEPDLDDQDIDLHDLVDAGPAQVTSGIDLVLKAFGPNTVIVEEG